ncbi:hypothetical protein CsSME_00003488 [Camellia sinensis var. sinensis]
MGIDWANEYQSFIVLSNPSDIAAFGYRGIGGSLEGLVRRVARAYHMADAAHITRDAREKSDAIGSYCTMVCNRHTDVTD